MSEFGNPRTDVRDALARAGWREDSRDRLAAVDGTVWAEVNDLRDSGLDVPAAVIVAACLAAAGQEATR